MTKVIFDGGLVLVKDLIEKLKDYPEQTPVLIFKEKTQSNNVLDYTPYVLDYASCVFDNLDSEDKIRGVYII